MGPYRYSSGLLCPRLAMPKARCIPYRYAPGSLRPKPVPLCLRAAVLPTAMPQACYSPGPLYPVPLSPGPLYPVPLCPRPVVLQACCTPYRCAPGWPCPRPALPRTAMPQVRFTPYRYAPGPLYPVPLYPRLAVPQARCISYRYAPGLRTAMTRTARRHKFSVCCNHQWFDLQSAQRAARRLVRFYFLFIKQKTS